MKYTTLIMALGAGLFFQACDTAGYPVTPSNQAEAPSTTNYTEPKDSGIIPVRPYPNANDVCQLLKVTSNLKPLITDGQTLIACPKHENGAIENRKSEGAKVVGNAKHWVILSVEN